MRQTGRPPRELVWVGSSRDDISQLPEAVKASFGYRLRQLQMYQTPADMKALRQFGAGVFELREAFERNAFRLISVVKLRKAIYVLHVFMKKSKSGIGIPREDADLIRVRLKRAQEFDAES